MTEQDIVRRDAEVTRRLRDMQRQIDDLSVVAFLCLCGVVVLLLGLIALGSQVLWS